MFAALFLFAQLATVAFAAPAPVLEVRQSVTPLTASQVSAYKPYTYYAAAAYCAPANTLAWNCGSKCTANSGFTTIASGGDGASTQYWYVGYDATLKTIIVGFQGTDASKILPVITDVNFDLKSLRTDLFPGVSSSVKTHDGFGDAQANSAAAVLAAVKAGISKYSATKVTLTGHSLGGAIAIISTAHLSVNLPSTISLRTITYGSPRVGNQEFVDFVNARSVMNRIDNQDDIVPILPGRFLGFAHTEGELHILNSNAWENCPGQDNTDSQCTIGYVPNVFSGDTGDHDGPYDGVTMGC
ncbi:Alpha/Beta hydrolase protein [Ephemerocybe angulata]|uniref:Alpha/Beta hydrolase protein n=1 Tax=Ephemerocybe angulata TaxID=980116 RepID=A0A8H6M6W0_9AGAR|nr:Alpha/Beta hydrolase protein [Tulosesus angulatus]